MKALEHIQLVSFDLDDTLYNNDQAMVHFLGNYTKTIESLLKIPAQVIDNAYLQVRAHFVEKTENLEFWRLMTLAMLCYKYETGHKNWTFEKAYARAQKIYFEKIATERETKIEVNKEVFDLLADLKSHYKLAVISNGLADIEKLKLESYFDYWYAPFLQDVRSKPNIDMFLDLEAESGIDAKSCLHIGDNIHADVAGAKRSGWGAVYFSFFKQHAQKENLILADYTCDSFDALRSLLLK